MRRKRKRRVPEVIWKVFGKQAQTLGDALLSLIPFPCIRQGDPSDYRTLLNHCFIVFSHPSPPPPFHLHSPTRYTQIQLVRNTIEILLSDDPSTNNVICSAYNKKTRSSPVLQALSSSSWNLLLARVGDELMVHLLRYSSIFVPLNTTNKHHHHQVSGFPITHLCWQHINNHHRHSSDTPHSLSIDIHIPGTSSCHGTQDNGLLSRKRLRSHACRRRCKRKRTKTSLPDKMKSLCSCCSVWQTLEKVPTENQINKLPMLYKLERTSSVLPEKHIINSLRPNASGAYTLFNDIFDVGTAVQGQCTHSNGMCAAAGAICLYHSLLKRLRVLIRKGIHCPRVKLLNKHILDQSPPH